MARCRPCEFPPDARAKEVLASPDHVFSVTSTSAFTKADKLVNPNSDPVGRTSAQDLGSVLGRFLTCLRSRCMAARPKETKGRPQLQALLLREKSSPCPARMALPSWASGILLPVIRLVRVALYAAKAFRRPRRAKEEIKVV